MPRFLLALLLLAILTTPAAAAAPPPLLEVGVGKADITPPVVGYFGGWANQDAVPRGVHTRLYARAIVLKQGNRKVALISEDLSFLGAGMIQHAVQLLPGRGFSEENIIDSATHTHGSPIGFMNFGTYNSVLPTLEHPTSGEAQPNDTTAMYAFMVKRLAVAIQRADDDLAPGALAWGSRTLSGITENRSLEAHLANHGIAAGPGEGSTSQDPLGVDHTIDPMVEVLRVDKLQGGKSVPVGMWSSFANHGTVNHYTWDYFNGDHAASASRVSEQALREIGGAPAEQEIVNVYGAGDEGDMSAGLMRSGPAAAEFTGRAEADRMVEAWKDAGRRLDSRPTIDLRWTRMCFCGQDTAEGVTDTEPIIGAAAGSGSEEARTIFNPPAGDLSYEGRALPADVGPQGRKVQTLREGGSVPQAVPLTTLQIGDRIIATVPGEMTVEMGRRTEKMVLGASAGSGVDRVVISGLANEYVSYFATPEEYDAQHYEGGFTLYGRTSSVAIAEALADLAARMTVGAPAPAAYEHDVIRGRDPIGHPFPAGATTATAGAQPADVARLQRARFSWTGGPNGTDRRLDEGFVTIERLSGGHWEPSTDDLGLQIAWHTGPDGVYDAQWEVPLDAKVGEYRFRILATGYELASEPFGVSPSRALGVEVVAGGRGVRVTYPEAVPYEDFTFRPESISGGTVQFTDATRARDVASEEGDTFMAPFTGATIAAGAARDAFGNVNGEPLVLP